MTIVLLASVCLFALVVAGRPVPSDAEFNDLAPTSATFQNTVQAAFQVHPGDDAALFRAPNPKQQIEYLSELDEENTATLASFEISGHAPLDNTADGQDGFGLDNKPDDSRAPSHTRDPVASDPLVDEHQDGSAGQSQYPTAPLVVLAFSCVAAFLALACITLTLYVIRALRYRMVASKRAWNLLPGFMTCPRSPIPQEDTTTAAKEDISREGSLLHLSEVGQHLPDAEEGSSQESDSHWEEKADGDSDIESDLDDVDGKYQDALDITPLPSTRDLPPEEHRSRFDDPPLSSSYQLDPAASDHSLLMHESCSSPVSRPAWSLRAMDSLALGLTSREGAGVDSTPLPLIHPRRRAYRSAVPEFDIALAMQLRPGLGIGADSAWMVRFLMTIFGWFAIAMTGNTR